VTNSFIEQLKRRNVFKVGIAYLVLAWVVIQIADVVVPALSLPEWTITFMIVIGMFGFPFALLFAWAYEITPSGIMKESEISPEDSITAHTGRKLNFIIIGLLIIGMSYFIYESRFQSEPEGVVATEETATESNTESSDVIAMEPQVTITDKSIAVLPFVNMSADKDQEYFADGISEEILNALVKATGLRVAGRTSSFSFKGKEATIKDIGEILKVAYVLEGSVRKQNQNVRITAQLIKAVDGFHLWSETYDGNLDNIFDLQEDISRKVTEQLKLILNLGVKQRLANNMTSDINAYDLFLRGREKVRKRMNNNIPEGIALLQQAVELDPNFAEAWSKLAEAEAVSYGYVPNIDQSEANSRAAIHIDRALEINEVLALPYAVKGLINQDQGHMTSAIEYYSKALKLEPNNSIAIRWLGNAYSILGFEDKSFPLFQQAYSLDPLSSIDTYNLGSVHFKLDNLNEALRFFQLSSEIRKNLLGMRPFIYSHQGQTSKAKDAFLDFYNNGINLGGAERHITLEQAKIRASGLFNGNEQQQEAARLLGSIRLNDTMDRFPWSLKYHVAANDIDRAYEILDTKPDLFINFAADDMWLPIEGMRKFREDPRFIKLLEKNNLPTAWQKLGWPNHCQPNPGTDGSNGQFQCR